MNSRIVLKATAIWVAILALAFLNGTLRELVLIPRWGRTPGLLASGLLLSLAVLAMARAGNRWYGPVSRAVQWRLGFFWLFLTLAFEWTFGLMQGKSVDALLKAYAFTDGNLWTLVLLVVILAPRLMGRGSLHS